MERPLRRHDHHLTIVQFIPLAGLGAFRQPEELLQATSDCAKLLINAPVPY
jgi:hypothetical protein